MARFKNELPNDLIKEFEKLNKNTYKMMSEMTEEAAKVVLKNTKSNMKKSFKNVPSQLEPKLSINYRTPSDDGVNTKIYWAGYYKEDTRTFKRQVRGKTYSYKGIPIPLIIRAREFGSSSGEAKKPFFRKSFKKSEIQKVMKSVQDKYIKE